MSCLCGDPACPSCGPAQGFCPRCVLAGLDRCECDDDSDEAYDLARQRELDEEREND